MTISKFKNYINTIKKASQRNKNRNRNDFNSNQSILNKII